MGGYGRFIVKTITSVLASNPLTFTVSPTAATQKDFSWKLDDQPGVKHCSIERSNDGFKFASIGKVTANAINNFIYQYKDSSSQTATNFFRL